MLALDDARVMILTAADAQPVAAEPFAPARDDGLAGRQRAARSERLGQRIRRDDVRQRTDDGRRAPHLGGEAAGHRRLRRRVLLDERDAPTIEAIQRAGHIVQPIHADRFEVIAERRLDRAFPAGLHFQRLRRRACCRRARGPRATRPRDPLRD